MLAICVRLVCDVGSRQGPITYVWRSEIFESAAECATIKADREQTIKANDLRSRWDQTKPATCECVRGDCMPDSHQ